MVRTITSGTQRRRRRSKWVEKHVFVFLPVRFYYSLLIIYPTSAPQTDTSVINQRCALLPWPTLPVGTTDGRKEKPIGNQEKRPKTRAEFFWFDFFKAPNQTEMKRVIPTIRFRKSMTLFISENPIFPPHPSRSNPVCLACFSRRDWPHP